MSDNLPHLNKISNDTFKWNFIPTNDNNNNTLNMSDWKWTNDVNKRENTSKQNDIQFSWNISDIDTNNDNNQSTWQCEESNDFSSIFTTDKLQSECEPLFVGLQPIKQHSNDSINSHNTDWCFHLVYIYIKRIPFNKQTIIPIEVIQMCYTYVIDKHVKQLIDMSTNMKLMQQHLKTMNYYYEQNKFIQINKSFIKQAYNMIDDINAIQWARHNVDKIKMDRKKEIIKKYNTSEVDEKMTNLYSKYELRVQGKTLLDEYYKLITHITGFDSGNYHWWTYKDWENWVKKEILLIHALHGVSQLIPNTNQIKYNLLKCNIITLSNNSEEYNMIEKYVTLTQGNDFPMKIENIYKLENAPYSKPFTKWKPHSTRMLLFYGDRITNLTHILMNGLSLPQDKIPDLVYKFGQGIYFSNMFCDALKKCYMNTKICNGLVLLCQVAIGDEICKVHPGNVGSDPSTYVTLKDGCVVPCGQPIQWAWQREYDQYVVVDTSQIKMKYLVEVTPMRTRKKRGKV